MLKLMLPIRRKGSTHRSPGTAGPDEDSAALNVSFSFWEVESNLRNFFVLAPNSIQRLFAPSLRLRASNQPTTTTTTATSPSKLESNERMADGAAG